MNTSKHPAKGGRWTTITSPGALVRTVLLVLFTAQAGWWAGTAGSAAAEPETPGCSSDYSVPNEVTMRCAPGAGTGEHAYIRCRDVVGILHTHIGETIRAEGGGSRAVCAPGENGPV